MITVKRLLKNNFQLVASEKLINPNINVMRDIKSTIFNGWMYRREVVSPTILVDAATIMKNPKQIKENIKDKNPILIFMLSLLIYLQKLLEVTLLIYLSP